MFSTFLTHVLKFYFSTVTTHNSNSKNLGESDFDAVL